MCAISSTFFVPVPCHSACTIAPVLAGVSSILKTSDGGSTLDLAAELAQPIGDQGGDLLQAFDVACCPTRSRPGRAACRAAAAAPGAPARARRRPARHEPLRRRRSLRPCRRRARRASVREMHVFIRRVASRKELVILRCTRRPAPARGCAASLLLGRGGPGRAHSSSEPRPVSLARARADRPARAAKPISPTCTCRAAGAVRRPPVDTRRVDTSDIAYALIRVLDDEGRAVGPGRRRSTPSSLSAACAR